MTYQKKILTRSGHGNKRVAFHIYIILKSQMAPFSLGVGKTSKRGGKMGKLATRSSIYYIDRIIKIGKAPSCFPFNFLKSLKRFI